MADSKETICGPCEYRNDTNSAIKWCTNCNESLCGSCYDIHASLKMSRNHHVIPVEDYHTIASIMEVSEYEMCKWHDKPCGFYCSSHDAIVCITCIQSYHGQCKSWLPLDEAAKGVKTSVAMTDLETDFKEVSENAENLISVYKDQRQYIENRKQDLKYGAENIRKQIIDKIKQLEEDFSKKLDIEYQREADSIDKETQNIAMMLDEIESLKHQIANLKEHASDAHIFIYMRKISKQCHEIIRKLKTFVNEGKEITIKIDFDSGISSLLSVEATLGCISIATNPISFQWTTLRKEGQIHVPLIAKKLIDGIIIDQPISIVVQNRAKEPIPVSGCAILPNNEIVFVEFDKTLLHVYSNSGKIFREISVPFKVKYITVIDESRIGLTSTGKYAVIYNILLSKLENKIEVSGDCYGLAYDNNKLFVVGCKHIHCLDLSTNSKSEIMVDTKDVIFVCIHDSKIYYSDSEKNIVHCCDLKGKLLWQFESSGMKRPLGIATDASGNVYVACRDSNNVFIISDDGQQHRELSFKTSNVLQTPRSINYDKKGNRLLIADASNGNALLYLLQ